MKMSPQERQRRRVMRERKALDWDCDRCSAHAGYPCQNTGRAKHPGTARKPHTPRMNRAFGYCSLRDWDARKVVFVTGGSTP